MSAVDDSHYVVLGVPRDADAACIRAAFRALAREHHPDHAGPEATARFQRMVEAYEVLSDPDSRRRYDQAAPRPRFSPRPGAHAAAPSPGPARARRPAVEPLDDPWPGSGTAAASEPATGGPKAVLPLTWWEARQGGRFLVALPFLRPCGHCGGSGVASPGICSWCGGGGRLADAWTLTLAVPPGLRSGDRLTHRVPWPDGSWRPLTILVRVL